MCTPRSSASRTVRSMVASSPACPPQAMLAEVMCSMSAASCAESSSSPMSQLRSVIVLSQSVEPGLLLLQQAQRLFDGNALEAHLVTRAKLAEAAEIGGDDIC